MHHTCGMIFESPDQYLKHPWADFQLTSVDGIKVYLFSMCYCTQSTYIVGKCPLLIVLAF
jgi:hypothetical protein